MTRRALAPTEHEAQVTYFEWVDLMAKQDDRYLNIFAIPNGGHRHKAVAAKLKAEGVRSGVPDILIAVPAGKYSGCFIEHKRPGNKPTPNQWEFLMRLKRWGYRVAVCFSVEELIQTTLRHMDGRDE